RNGARRREKGDTLVAHQAKTVGELRGQLARGAAEPLLQLLDRIGGTVELLRQRLLGQVAALAQPAQHAPKRFISTHRLLVRSSSYSSLVTSIAHGASWHHPLVIVFVTLCVTIVILPLRSAYALIPSETNDAATESEGGPR